MPWGEILGADFMGRLLGVLDIDMVVLAYSHFLLVIWNILINFVLTYKDYL